MPGSVYQTVMMDNLIARISELEQRIESMTKQEEKADSTLVSVGYLAGLLIVALGVLTSSAFPIVVGAALGGLAMVHSLRMDELRERSRT